MYTKRSSVSTAPNGTAASIYAMKKAYDAAAINIVKERPILAYILKYCVPEFQDCSLKEIENEYIEGVVVSRAPVDPDSGNPTKDPETDMDADMKNKKQETPAEVVKPQTKGSKIVGLSNEDKSVTEGKVVYDIRMIALAPGLNGHIKLYINIELQRESEDLQYAVSKRGIYYACRMISSQKNTEFKNDNYQDIKKVYSLWILQDLFNKKKKNSLVYYYMEEHVVLGDVAAVHARQEDYDLLEVVLIGLGGPQDPKTDSVPNDAIRLLSTVLSDELDAETKVRNLENNFGIPMTEEVERSVNHMCNLSDGIFNKGIKQGFGQGFDQGKEKEKIDTVDRMIEGGESDEKISSYTGMPISEIQKRRNLCTI